MKKNDRIDKEKPVNNDARLQKESKVINEEYVYIIVEPNNPKDHRYEHETVAEGPYKVTKADNKICEIEKMYRYIKTLSRSRVLLAPKIPSRKEVEKRLKPITINDEYPKPLTKQGFIIKEIVAVDDEEDGNNEM